MSREKIRKNKLKKGDLLRYKATQEVCQIVGMCKVNKKRYYQAIMISNGDIQPHKDFYLFRRWNDATASFLEGIDFEIFKDGKWQEI